MRPQWRLLIVEDDRHVARVLHQLASEHRMLHVVGIAGTAAQARRMLSDLRPDLVFLDLGLRGEDGLGVLRELRSRDTPVEVIAITANASGHAVRTALQLGVLDYVVKPFHPSRLSRAIATFLRHAAALRPDQLDQGAVDAMRTSSRWLPRDIAEETLAAVRDVVRDPAAIVTADEVATALGVTRVTARRYLEFMVTVGELMISTRMGGKGRPRKTYQLRSNSSVADASGRHTAQ